MDHESAESPAPTDPTVAAGDTPSRDSDSLRLDPIGAAGQGFVVEGGSSYQLIRLLGEGGMGRVFLAERVDGEFHQRVAIKLLAWYLGDDEAATRRFRVERQILAQLGHPNIARLFDGGTTAQGQPYLVMEFVEGGVPIDRFVEEAQLTVEARVRLFLKVCDAVRSAHQRLVVHRDLKPGNILVTPEGDPKLLDFGIAKLLSSEVSGLSVETQHGEISLTPRYASPEQMRAETITTASDVYALGVVLYELLAGRSPYKPESLNLLRLPTAVCSEIPPPPSWSEDGRRRDIGPDLDAIVLKALRKEPWERYASVEALVEDLDCYLDGRPVAAREGNTAYQLSRFVHRHRWSVSVAGLVVLLLVGWTVSTRYQLAQVEKERRMAERARELLVEVVSASDPAQARSRELTAREVLDLATQRVRARKDDPPELRASLLASLGRVYLSQGLLDRAEPLLEEALATGLAPGPRYAAERARAALALARLRYEQGRAAESVELLRAALAAEGPRVDDGLRAAMVARLGHALVERGSFDEGETVLREALAIGRRAPQTPRAELVECLATLGLVIAVRTPSTKRDEAEAFLLEAIALARKPGLDPVDPLTLEQALENLAWIYLDAGEWRRAEPVLDDAEAIGREYLGEEHSSLLDLRNYRALLEWRRGDFAAAEATLQRVMTLHPKMEGFPTYERLRGNLGAMKISQGRFAEGEAQVQEALAAHRRTGTVGWADVFYDLWILSFSAFDRGDMVAAREFSDQAAQEAARLPPEMPYLPQAYTYRGAASSWLDGPQAGESDLRLAVERQGAILPPDHPDRVTPLAELAAALLRSGRLDEAEPLAREAARIALTLPDFHWERAWALAVAAAVQLERGVPAGRAGMAEQLPCLERRHGPTHPRVQWLRQLLADRR